MTASAASAPTAALPGDVAGDVLRSRLQLRGDDPPDGAAQRFASRGAGDRLESVEEIPEPHAFTVRLYVGDDVGAAVFEEHEHAHEGAHHRDNTMRAAVVHVLADAAVSVLVIIGLVLARVFGWLWMDSMPDKGLAARLRGIVEAEGGAVEDLHLWRLGPGSPRRDRLGDHAWRARRRLLSQAPGALPLDLTSHGRGDEGRRMSPAACDA